MQATVTRRAAIVKSNRKPIVRKPLVRRMDGTSITCLEPVCTVDYSPCSLAWTVETMLEQDERAHEAAMVAAWEADAEAQYLASRTFGYGLFPLDMAR